jgi:hypothetical protein
MEQWSSKGLETSYPLRRLPSAKSGNSTRPLNFAAAVCCKRMQNILQLNSTSMLKRKSMDGALPRSATTSAMLLAALALSACTPKYIQPAHGAALVRLHLTDARLFAMVHTYEKEACESPRAIGLIGGARFVNAAGESERVIPEMLGSSGTPKPETIEVRVHANKPFTVLYSQMGPHDVLIARSCKLPVTFTPRASEQYQIDYSYESGRCFSTVSRLVSYNGSIEKKPIVNAFKESASCSPYIR